MTKINDFASENATFFEVLKRSRFIGSKSRSMCDSLRKITKFNTAIIANIYDIASENIKKV